MGRLFWKIFLSFWFTLLLIGVTVSFGTAIYLHNSDEFQIRDLRSRYVMQRVQAIRQALRFNDFATAIEMLENSQQHARQFQIYVFDDFDQELLGRTIPQDTAGLAHHRPVMNDEGDFYHIMSVQNFNKRPNLSAIVLRPFKNIPGIFFVWISIALALSGMVCFWLAWYLTRPIRYLQRASRDLSRGLLNTRVAHVMGNRRDEIADLGQDFDLMATRLQNLINSQKQLLSDISHELRSPLARIQLALGLARKKSGQESQTELWRIEHETNRLNDLVGQALTLSRLDAGASYPTEDYIDVGELLHDIIKDCDFEARDQNKEVKLSYTSSWTINANAELFRRALENIIRNAIHYTANNSHVEVSLRANPDHSGGFMILICDQGPGVPEDKLETLFEPFFRLSAARDRDSGGYGLGLAIAKRAITFHKGEIRAYNMHPIGLCVEILLPGANS